MSSFINIVRVDSEEIGGQYGYNNITAVSVYNNLPPFSTKRQGEVTEFLIKKYSDNKEIDSIVLSEFDVIDDDTYLYYLGAEIDNSLATKLGSWGNFQYYLKIDGVEYKSAFKFNISGYVAPFPILVRATTTDDSGTGDGTITVNAIGGYPPLEYSKDDGATYQGSNIFIDLIVGDYIIKVKDSKGFESYSQVISVGGQLGFTHISTPDTGTSDGTITVTAVGGIPPIEYSKDNGGSWQGSNVFTNLTHGNYTVIIRDSVLNESLPQVVSVDTLPVTFIYTSFPDTGGGVGSIQVTASGGIAPYSYSIDNGATYQGFSTFSNLTADTYITIVKDSLGVLSDPQNIVIALDIPVIVISLIFTTNEASLGAADGTARIDAAAGISIEYSIDDITYQSSKQFNNVPNGIGTGYVRQTAYPVNKESAPFEILAFPAAPASKFSGDLPNILPNPGSGSRIAGQWYWSIGGNVGTSTVTQLAGNAVKMFVPTEGMGEIATAWLTYKLSTPRVIGKRYGIKITHSDASTKDNGLDAQLPVAVGSFFAISGAGVTDKYFVNSVDDANTEFEFSIILRGDSVSSNFIDITNVEILEFD